MESPFREILYTNSTPSDSECQSIRDLLVGPRQQIAVLTDEIVATQALLDELTSKRAVLDEFVAAHLALVSSVRRVPTDIMQEIFVASLPSGQNSTITEQDAPLLLCHICRAWRSLALSTPRLWASLHISVPYGDRISSMNNVVNEWLSRSGILPLSISVAFIPRVPDSAPTSMLLNTLVNFSSRWEHIRFRFPVYEYLNPLASLSPSDVPILRTVAMDIFHRFDDQEWNNLGFIGTPSLHSAMIPSKTHGDSLNLLLIPVQWERLRRLSIQGTYYTYSDVALAILQKCTLLETLSLSIMHASGNLSPATPCRMDHLRNLYVSYHNSQPDDFFAHLIAPRLVCLEYMGASSDSQYPFMPMLSSCSLECLRLKPTSAVYTESLIGVLSLVPTLRQLVLSGEPWLQDAGVLDGRFILSLNRMDAGDVLCPDLEQIELLYFDALSDQTLLEFIQARGAAIGRASRLSSVRALLGRPMETDIIPLLQPLIDDGLDVALDYDYQPQAPHMYSPSEALERDGADSWAPISRSWYPYEVE
ncbi:hypothetical protein DFH07DRAFT_1065961 [Mycena maculata]|uniref:F-box domain-containing protein n=1 Tax=Mycena maculata TaxID=230809 RepID=A0AAD7HYP9_9AGAR|nr:hypothetical protein DFH07DRAFT_1065961 [Mycena maculata]